MLLILMYHRILDPKIPLEITLHKFEEHLKSLLTTFHIVIPGQRLLKKNICLTFDDAYFDFYLYIFPILKKLNIPTILAIPAGLIADNTTIATETRLDLEELSSDNNHNPHFGLCTWVEIQHMLDSGLIYPGSHSLSHRNLTSIDSAEIYQELFGSKKIILSKLEKITEIFIYPFGAYNKKINVLAAKHYSHVMRIGNASNTSWEQKILYRIDANPFWKNNTKFSRFNFFIWKLKYFWNQLRNK